MKRDVIAELVEENERLRDRLNNERDYRASNEKMGSFFSLVIFGLIYALALEVILRFAWNGALFEISTGQANISATVTFFLMAKVVLMVFGAMAFLIAAEGIFHDDIIDFLYRVSKAFARYVEETDAEDDFDFIDEAIVEHIEDQIREGEDKIRFVRAKQYRNRLGQFAKKK